MAAKPSVAIVGPGRLGSALTAALTRARYPVIEILSRNRAASLRRARALAKVAGAKACRVNDAQLEAELIWLCVPDREIAATARILAPMISWENKIAFHSSGALASDELDVLRRRGAAVASVHPLMTFVKGTAPSLAGVPFALQGDAAALRTARRTVRDLGAIAFTIGKQAKPTYHAWGAFASPLLVALLVTAEQVAQAAGLSRSQARRRILPIIQQTIENYSRLGPGQALSGPLVRGDSEIVRQHLQQLNKIPVAKEVYRALSRSAVRYLPVGQRKKLKKILF